ncbi:MAG: DNA-3-methyladenine glycosylase I [Enterobacteriaceae bacterium]|jgi:DNA-3-methyladenine glycosylase I|nr:DNA-3-methyladenine glycosylase I [Enterobacteriaceae bacterium]
MQRCSWVNQEPLYIAYHDNEWGKPIYDNHKLFEKICLEGQQAGLSWITVLKKRETYRQCFHYFDPQKIAAMTSEDIDRLVQNAGLIRHRGKLEAIISNAKAYLTMQENGEDFSAFIWSFVDHHPVVNHFSLKNLQNFPTSTPTSDAMAKALKKRGFKFVGTTICYAYMQSMGLVNDHLIECFCHPDQQE